MKSAFTYWIAFLLVTIGTNPVARSAEDNKPGNRQAWVVTASVPEKMDATLRIYSGGESVEIPKNKRANSPALKIDENGIVSVAKPNEDSSPGEPLIEISVPEIMQQVLIILLPKVDATDGMKFESKLFDLSSFKPGDWLFLNLTTSIIRVTEDGKSLEITANTEALSKLPSSKELKSYSISYDYKKNVGDDWSTISASSVVRQPERREICIFTEDPELETIDYHALSFMTK